MSGEYSKGICELFEDFSTDNGTAASGYGGLTETAVDSGAQDITDKHGGWWRMTLPAGGADALSIAGERAWEVDEGHPLIFETRLTTSSVTDFCICVGFGDDVDSDSLAILFEDEAGAIASNCADGFAFLVEGDQDATWQAVAVDTDIDKTQEALTLGADIAADTIQTLRLEANPNDSGTVKYFIDGELVATKTSWFDSSIVYCPILSTDDRDVAANVDFDYLYVMAPRS